MQQPAQERRMPKIHFIFQAIGAKIRSLFDISSLLRRPKVVDKYIRSTATKLDKESAVVPECLDLTASFRKHDEAHVVEKILQWRGLSKCSRDVPFETEEPVTTGQMSEVHQIQDVLWFKDRLAVANTRRREQLKYWVDHPYESAKDSSVTSHYSNPLPEATRAVVEEARPDSTSQAPTLKPADNDNLKAAASTFSKQSFSTAAVSDVHETKTNFRQRTQYAPTEAGQQAFNSIPPPPSQNGEAWFACPYCGVSLLSSDMTDRQSWKYVRVRNLRLDVDLCRLIRVEAELTTQSIDGTYFTTCALTCALLKSVRIPGSCTSVGMTGCITNCKPIDESTHARPAIKFSQIGAACKGTCQPTMTENFLLTRLNSFQTSVIARSMWRATLKNIVLSVA